MSAISSFRTMRETVRFAKSGLKVRDKNLAFLLAGFGVIGQKRAKVRNAYYSFISRYRCDNAIRLAFFLNSQKTEFEFRSFNEGDYLVACEFVRGFYQIPNDTPESIVDCGANIGSFSLHAKPHFPNANLDCYEPDPQNFELLTKNMALNQLEAELRPVGVWSKDCTLYYHAQTAETGYIDETPPGVPIQCELPVIAPNCWLKIDVEGAEYEVLPGLFNKGRFPRWISMEIHHFQSKGEPLITLLKEHGYVLADDFDRTADCFVISAEKPTV
jgi:FkbM family methyltransferase